MKYLKSQNQFEDILKKLKIIIIVFVDPAEFMPSKSLLNYMHSHQITR
jgi:hypothetical protein